MLNSKPKNSATSFFNHLSNRAKSKFYIGVFLLFAATTMIYDLVAPAGIRWYVIASWCVYSGLVAVGWAYAFTRRMWVLYIVVPLSFLLPFFFGRSFYSRESLPLLLLIEAALTILLIGWGYAMFVNFISDEGSKTLRLQTEIALAEEIHSGLVPQVDYFQVQKPGMFATFACIQFDDSPTAQYALAGHNAILHYRPAAKSLERLPNEAPPLGVVPDHPYKSATVQVSKGDTLVILTDGLTEVFDENGEEFGEERIEKILVANADKALSEIHNAIMKAVRAHGPQMDDQTLLLARVM